MDKAALAFDLLPLDWRGSPLRAEGLQAEEIRLRRGRAPALLVRGRELPLSGRCVTEEDMFRVLEKATGASVHASAASLREGYINYRGLRIGVCGVFQRAGGERESLLRLSSLAIRIPREYRGICGEAADSLYRSADRSLLLAGAPGAGKTTALRELIRNLSERGLRIGVADERNELAALDARGEGFDLGRCSDVVTGLPKAEAAMLLLRGMNPQLIAMDEITREEDLTALDQIAGCGVGILATVHGTCLRDLRQRSAYRRLLDRGLFQSLLLVEQDGARRVYRRESVGA